jgi:transcriptional regulator GlxA family with amidase domain
MFTRSNRPSLLKALAYLATIVLLPVLVGGISVARRMNAPGPGPVPAYAAPLPALPAHDPAKKTAVVLSSAYGAEITDFLPPYEILARAGTFNVYALAPERKVLPLVNSNMKATTLDFVPHFSFAEYNATIGQAPDLIVVPWFPDYTAERDAAVLAWIRANAGPHTNLLTICAGTQILAETGLLDGRTATTNTGWFSKLERPHPSVTWVRDVRYYDDGKVITSTNLASGIDATLRAVDRLAGRTAAEDVARQLGYRYTQYLDDPAFRPSMAFLLPTLANMAFHWQTQDLGILLYDGVSEVALAGVIDPYSSSLVARTHVIAPERRAIQSRNGLTFVPRTDAQTAAQLDRIVLPGGDATEAMRQTVARWAQQRPEVPVEQIHRHVGTGESAYDATLKDMARTRSRMLATATGQALFYPTAQLQIDAAGWPVAPVAAPLTLSLLGVGLLAAIGRAKSGAPRMARMVEVSPAA